MGVKVQLFKSYSNKPIIFQKVQIYNESTFYEANTDRNGIADFSASIIPDGKYVIKIRSPEYKFAAYTEKTYISRNSIINIKLHPASEL